MLCHSKTGATAEVNVYPQKWNLRSSQGMFFSKMAINITSLLYLTIITKHSACLQPTYLIWKYSCSLLHVNSVMMDSMDLHANLRISVTLMTMVLILVCITRYLSLFYFYSLIKYQHRKTSTCVTELFLKFDKKNWSNFTQIKYRFEQSQIFPSVKNPHWIDLQRISVLH